MSKRVSQIAGAMLVVLVSAGSQADPLIVYSPQGEERGQWIAEQARAAGHDMEFLHAGGGELFDRLLAEQANSQADVVLGLVDVSMVLLKEEGLFQRYVPSWAAGLPDAYKDPDGFVHKFWQTPVVIAYNADALAPADAPRSWLDLIKPEFKGKYVIGSSGWQTTRVYLAGILARFMDAEGEVSDRGWKFMRQFYDNAGLVTDNGDELNREFSSGDAVINLNWFGGVGRLAELAGYRAQIVDTEGGTPYIAEGIAIMAGTDQFDAAAAFVDWFGSPQFMIAYANKFGQLPAHPDAIAGLPAELQEKSGMLHPQPIDWNLVAPKLDGWIQRIELDIK